MDDDLYCKLYVDTDESKDWLVAALAKATALDGPWPELSSSRNMFFVARPAPGDVYDFITASRFIVDCEPHADAEMNRSTFEAAIIAVILALRTNGAVVSAACDFEDRIAMETGGQWRADA